MSDAPKRWPSVACAARNQAAVLAMEGMKALSVVVDGERAMTESERQRRETKALRALERIAWLMHSQGAPIRPEDL
ncbi:MAG: hypothetical protein CVU44_11145 [Chloroflexi bacterium HGW-Chloroflexi-6]|nr:MAG: hypothetical protein CVU44_11145 [Chloroflexi bacterium HGW-Chloroflexi-6]